jgi:beta-galactosidase
VTDVWLNGKHLGQHKGAFARFRFDATDALKFGGDNLLVVRADNSKAQTPGSPTAEVIPISGDWPMYGGLYRSVALVLTHAVHVDMLDFGGPGVYAHTATADANSASVEVLTRLKNDSDQNAALHVMTSVVDDKGKTVGSAVSVRIATGAAGETRQTINVVNPRLWNGTADPYLYTVRVQVRDKSGAILDEVTQPLGIRTVRIDASSGFYLNDKPVRLHGVSRHQDLQGKGWALDTEELRRDMALIREIGANTVRFAHYQHHSYSYQLADENGFIAWAEIPLVNRTAPLESENTTPAFAANAEQQLRELIRQNYNHPSIAVWSIGNEMNLDAAKGRTVSNAGPLLKQLHAVVKSEDALRPSTLADCCGSVPSEARKGLDTVAGITDVIGFNRYFGWYTGEVGGLTNELTRLHQLYPNQALSVSEYGAGGALTQHSDDPGGGPIHAFGRPHPEEFQSAILEASWRQIDALPFVWASWVWNMFDFSNDARMEGDLIDTNDKGLVTFDRQTKKDAFYFYKANWSAEPVLYIAGRRYADRT